MAVEAEGVAPEQAGEHPKAAGRDLVGGLIRILLIGTSLFHLWTGLRGPLESLLHRSLALTLYLTLLFLLPLYRRPDRTRAALWKTIPFALAALAIGVYIWSIYDTFGSKLGNVSDLDMVFGYLLIIVVLVAVKRSMGWPLVILAVVFLVYARFGPYFPGILGHRGLVMSSIIETVFFSQDGVLGFPIGIMSTFVFLFILFGSFFEAIGLTELLASLARLIAARVTGGAALASVVASGLVGSVSGSAVSNVMVTGSFTIPMMRRSGYRPELAAAVEAAASTGGQIMPPIMGIAAFVMAEVIGIPYLDVVLIALVPALLYFSGVGFSVYFASKRDGILTEPSTEAESLGYILRTQGFLMLPLVAIVVALVSGASLARVAMIGIASCIVIGALNPRKRFRLREFFGVLEEGARVAVSIGAVLAWVGLTVGLILSSGFASLIAGTLTRAFAGNLTVMLLIAMVTSLILGMGMTTVAVYVTLAITVVPSLINLGVHPYAAHFFAFYFGVLSYVTPPVCIATYAAAGLAGAPPGRSGWVALGLTLSGFLIPFAAVYEPALILQGPPATVAVTVITAFLGVVALSAAVQGFLLHAASLPQRLLLAIAGLLLITPVPAASLVGAVLFAGVGLAQWTMYKASPPRVPSVG